MTPQQVFDTVVSHLRQQGCKSLSEERYDDGGPLCTYRGTNNTKCAAGCLIPDEEYLSRFEGKNFQYILRIVEGLDKKKNFPVIRSLTDHLTLIDCLQRMHDTVEVSDWETRLVSIARGFDLQYQLPQSV